MPTLSTPSWTIDYAEAGQGPAVILLHSSVSGNRQWRSLTTALSDRYRVIAPNLFGYGQTSPWPAVRPQTLDDHLDLVRPFIDASEGEVAVVGHSFGGAVAMKAALDLPRKVTRLVLLEPNPFRLLDHHGRRSAYEEAHALRDFVKAHGVTEDWERVAAHFSDYWNGEGTWATMPAERRIAFASAVKPNFHEWDAVLGDESLLDGVEKIGAETLVISARSTTHPMAEIVEVLRLRVPDWTYAEVPEGGHMAPLTRPDLVNPVVCEFLDRAGANKA